MFVDTGGKISFPKLLFARKLGFFSHDFQDIRSIANNYKPSMNYLTFKVLYTCKTPYNRRKQWGHNITDYPGTALCLIHWGGC